MPKNKKHKSSATAHATMPKNKKHKKRKGTKPSNTSDNGPRKRQASQAPMKPKSHSAQASQAPTKPTSHIERAIAKLTPEEKLEAQDIALAKNTSIHQSIIRQAKDKIAARKLSGESRPTARDNRQEQRDLIKEYREMEEKTSHWQQQQEMEGAAGGAGSPTPTRTSARRRRTTTPTMQGTAGGAGNITPIMSNALRRQFITPTVQKRSRAERAAENKAREEEEDERSRAEQAAEDKAREEEEDKRIDELVRKLDDRNDMSDEEEEVVIQDDGDRTQHSPQHGNTNENTDYAEEEPREQQDDSDNDYDDCDNSYDQDIEEQANRAHQRRMKERQEEDEWEEKHGMKGHRIEHEKQVYRRMLQHRREKQEEDEWNETHDMKTHNDNLKRETLALTEENRNLHKIITERSDYSLELLERIEERDDRISELDTKIAKLDNENTKLINTNAELNHICELNETKIKELTKEVEALKQTNTILEGVIKSGHHDNNNQQSTIQAMIDKQKINNLNPLTNTMTQNPTKLIHMIMQCETAAVFDGDEADYGTAMQLLMQMISMNDTADTSTVNSTIAEFRKQRATHENYKHIAKLICDKQFIAPDTITKRLQDALEAMSIQRQNETNEQYYARFNETFTAATYAYKLYNLDTTSSWYGPHVQKFHFGLKDPQLQLVMLQHASGSTLQEYNSKMPIHMTLVQRQREMEKKHKKTTDDSQASAIQAALNIMESRQKTTLHPDRQQMMKGNDNYNQNNTQLNNMAGGGVSHRQHQQQRPTPTQYNHNGKRCQHCAIHFPNVAHTHDTVDCGHARRNNSPTKHAPTYNTHNNTNKCYNCGEAGHMSRACTKPPKPKGTCYNCGKPGHFARECRARKPNHNIYPQSPTRRNYAPQQRHTQQQRYNTTPQPPPRRREREERHDRDRDRNRDAKRSKPSDRDLRDNYRALSNEVKQLTLLQQANTEEKRTEQQLEFQNKLLKALVSKNDT